MICKDMTEKRAASVHPMPGGKTASCILTIYFKYNCVLLSVRLKKQSVSVIPAINCVQSLRALRGRFTQNGLRPHDENLYDCHYH